MTYTQTKWDLVTESEREWMLKTPFGGQCIGCNQPLATEADFAKHFIIPDPIYKNLGYCPKSNRR
jgi:hypothetical protein